MKGETTPPRSGDAAIGAAPGLSAVCALVRTHDRDRYRTALFAPAERREALFALYAFNYEIARVRESVTTPLLGQIRLQWWREAVDAAYAGMPARAHLVAAPLAAIIRDHALSRRHLDRLIDARERDLADEPPATLAALEDYAEASSATLVWLALQILSKAPDRGDLAGNTPSLTLACCPHPSPPPRAGEGGEGVGREGWGAAGTAAIHVGIAYALVGLLRAMPLHARAGRCYIPQGLAADTGLDPNDYAGLRPSPALRRAVETIGGAAARHLGIARDYGAEVSRVTLPALLPAVVAERALARLRNARWNPFDARGATADPLLTWRLAAAMLRRRF